MGLHMCYTIAGAGGLEVLKHVREQGCEWNENTCRSAALGGHLELLKWARANGCLWNEDTCSGAASGGHLEILKWARANGCLWVVTWIEANRGFAAADGEFRLGRVTPWRR